MISFIFAMDRNWLIGSNNQLPWHLPGDLAFFKRVTMGHPIVMGRKTFESIGRPLPGRENMIVTRQKDFEATGCIVFHTAQEVVTYSKHYQDEVFVIGGSEIFKQLLPHADRLYVTYIDEEFEGNTHFPKIDLSNWELQFEEKGIKDEKNPYDYYFRIYHRT